MIDGDENCRLAARVCQRLRLSQTFGYGSSPKCTENGGLPADIGGLLLSCCLPAAIFAVSMGCLEGCVGKAEFGSDLYLHGTCPSLQRNVPGQ